MKQTLLRSLHYNTTSGESNKGLKTKCKCQPFKYFQQSTLPGNGISYTLCYVVTLYYNLKNKIYQLVNDHQH